MPMKPGKPCAYPGCPEIVHGRNRYCDKHQAQEWRRESRERRAAGTHADYGPRWREISKRYLRDHPTCERCGAPAEVVHHLIPGDHSALQSLCRSCHSKVHAERGDYF
jgi:5-methylcytosine-specific restriction protein A